MNDTEDKKGKEGGRKKRRKIVEDIFCLKKYPLAKIYAIRKWGSIIFLSMPLRELKVIEKKNIAFLLKSPNLLDSFIVFIFHLLTNLSNLCPDYYIWRVEEKKTSGKTVVAGIAFSKAWQGVGGHMAQWIPFSLHTQLARVWFSEFIIIFLLILLRFIVGTV